MNIKVIFTSIAFLTALLAPPASMAGYGTLHSPSPAPFMEAGKEFHYVASDDREVENYDAPDKEREVENYDAPDRDREVENYDAADKNSEVENYDAADRDREVENYDALDKSREEDRDVR